MKFKIEKQQRKSMKQRAGSLKRSVRLTKEKNNQAQCKQANQKLGILCDRLRVNICLSPVGPELDELPKCYAK